MAAHTRDFVSSPASFLQQWTVDNALVQRTITAGTLFAKLNNAKKCYFQLKELSTTTLGFGSNKVELKLGATSADLPSIGNDFAVGAYWCPFLQGKDEVGWVDLPAANPQHKFCLTAAMQGCWFVITDSVPASPATFRLHHHQHPEDKALWQKMSPPTHIASHPNPPVTSTLARNTMKYSVYGAAEEGAATSANAFNVLVHENGVWNFLSQAHLLMPTAKGFNVARNSAFPIYTAQAYP